MSYSDPSPGYYQACVAEASASERAEFLAKTYAHLAGAIFAFVALEAVLINSAFGLSLARSMVETSWLLVLGLFIGASWIGDRWARAESTPMQYAGLALYVVAEALIFLPIMFYASNAKPAALAPAAGLTLLVFGGLTAYVFITKADFSWLRGILVVSGLLAFGAIAFSVVVGMPMGTWFCVAMVGFASASILYNTSAILHEFPVGGHVGAALALFASVMLLFWYILRLFMDSD